MKRVKAHRKAWEILHGPIPAGMLVMHTCDQPACVRPNHLTLGTHLDNQRDKWAKGRGKIVVWNRKLTFEQADEIRARYATGTIRQRTLADEYGVDQTTVSEIVNGKSYVH
jgi:hypothetical protein